MKSMHGAKILIVEDSLTAAKRLQQGLENAGFVVQFARNGKEALTQARQKKFDIIVTDEQMPVMSGQELCSQLRSIDRYVDVPILFLTANREKLDEEFLKNVLDVSAIFDKPFNPPTIVHFVESLLRVAPRTEQPAPSTRAEHRA